MFRLSTLGQVIDPSIKYLPDNRTHKFPPQTAKHAPPVKVVKPPPPRRDPDPDPDPKILVDGGCLAWSIVFSSFMISFLQVDYDW